VVGGLVAVALVGALVSGSSSGGGGGGDDPMLDPMTPVGPDEVDFTLTINAPGQ